MPEGRSAVQRSSLGRAFFFQRSATVLWLRWGAGLRALLRCKSGYAQPMQRKIGFQLKARHRLRLASICFSVGALHVCSLVAPLFETRGRFIRSLSQ